MHKVSFVSPFTEDAINTLKILALYFDEIEIVQDQLVSVRPEDESRGVLGPGDIGIVTGVTDLIDNEFKLSVKTLINESILKIKEHDFVERMLSKEKLLEICGNAQRLISEKPDLLIREHEIHEDETGKEISGIFSFSDDEVANVHKKYIGDLQIGSTFDMGFIYQYYASLLTDLLAMLSAGNVAVSGSPVLGTFLSYSVNSKSFEEFNSFLQRTSNLSPHIAHNLLKLTLLDVSRFSFEDILEFRRQLRDELERFREDLGAITYSVLTECDERHLIDRLDEIVKYRILPSVNELENKVKHSETKLLLRLLDALKNPAAYVPFLGSVFHMIPLQLAFFLSLGLVSFETAISFIIEQKQLTNNGLYYLVQLRKKTRR